MTEKRDDVVKMDCFGASLLAMTRKRACNDEEEWARNDRDFFCCKGGKFVIL